jgi:hypothetical protein
LRGNLLFGREYDEERYEKVVEASALIDNLVVLSAGDPATLTVTITVPVALIEWEDARRRSVVTRITEGQYRRLGIVAVVSSGVVPFSGTNLTCAMEIQQRSPAVTVTVTMSSTTLDLEISLERKSMGALNFFPSLLPK